MRKDTVYKRSNLFSGDNTSVSDGLELGYSEIVLGRGLEANIGLNNAGAASVVMEQRRADEVGAWAEIGVTVVASSSYRMLLQSNMKYRWRVKIAGSLAAVVSIRRTVPTSLGEKPVYVRGVPYSDGFPEPADQSISSFLATLNPNELTLQWSLARAEEEYWTTANPFTIGSNGQIYMLNPDRGGGIAGNPEIDPVAGDGTTTASWIATGSSSTGNFTMQFKTTTAAPTVGTVPSDLPSSSVTGVNAYELQFYADALVGYQRNTNGWGELGRWVPSTTGTTGLSSYELWLAAGNTGTLSEFLDVPDATYEYFSGSQTFDLSVQNKSNLIRHWFDAASGNQVMTYPEGLSVGTQIDHVVSRYRAGNTIQTVIGDGSNEPIHNWKDEVDTSDGRLEASYAGEYSIIKVDDDRWREIKPITYVDSEIV